MSDVAATRETNVQQLRLRSLYFLVIFTQFLYSVIICRTENIIDGEIELVSSRNNNGDNDDNYDDDDDDDDGDDNDLRIIIFTEYTNVISYDVHDVVDDPNVFSSLIIAYFLCLSKTSANLCWLHRPCLVW